MRIRRDIASIPARSATDTWDAIEALVIAKNSIDVDQLKNAGNIIAALITDELPAQSPLIFEGSGPQLRIYCSFGFKAIEAGLDIDPLTFNPTEGDWTLHVPCDAANLAWVKKALKATPRIKPFDLADAAPVGQDATINNNNTKAGDIVIDWTVKG